MGAKGGGGGSLVAGGRAEFLIPRAKLSAGGIELIPTVYQKSCVNFIYGFELSYLKIPNKKLFLEASNKKVIRI